MDKAGAISETGVMIELAILSWLINALGGAIGGNVIGAMRRSASAGPLANTLLGVAGGLLSGWAVAQAPDLIASVRALMNNHDGLTQAALGLIGGLAPALIASLFRRPA
jgi:uncharacterized membrane protein YeaQ/YmgE (transglycosylase-associated protein family)